MPVTRPFHPIHIREDEKQKEAIARNNLFLLAVIRLGGSQIGCGCIRFYGLGLGLGL